MAAMLFLTITWFKMYKQCVYRDINPNRKAKTPHLEDNVVIINVIWLGVFNNNIELTTARSEMACFTKLMQLVRLTCNA